MSKLKKIQGCLIGGAVGDMVGSPVEMAPSHEVQRYINNHIIPKDFKGVVRDHNGISPFGQYTDDTQLSRELILSLISHQYDFMGDFAERLQTVFSTDQVVGYGGATKQAVQNLIDGTHWSESGVSSFGNGSVMRAAPIGLYFDNVADIKKYSNIQSKITHATPQAYFGSTVMALAVHKLLNTNSWNPKEFFSFLIEETKDYEWWKYLTKLFNLIHSSQADLLIEIQSIEKAPQNGIPAFAVSSVLWSLVSFAQNPYSFWDTIKMSIWCSGDVDSTAALAGNLSGAFLGIDAIPLEISNQINDRGKYGYEYFLELGQLMIQ